ncbi:MAG: helix-turn-helix transcriptional regulator [Magnetococcales bacterium]|nr:helix-turn-helix transcriptional regulator [Magnetococcales bacterium]
MSQTKVAKKARTTQKVVSKNEPGEGAVGMDLLQRIAHTLDFRVSLVFCWFFCIFNRMV